MPGQGLDSIPLRIPKDWDPRWFELFVRDVLSLADIRNATEGPGIAISGASDEEATVSASADLAALLEAALVVAIADPDLPNARQLVAGDGSITITDSGDELALELTRFGVTLDRLMKIPALSILGSQNLEDPGNVDVVQAAADDTLLSRTSGSLAFTQLTAGMFPNAVVPDAALSDNVALLDGDPQTFTGVNEFTGNVRVGPADNVATIPAGFDGPFNVAAPGGVAGPIFVRNLAAGVGQSLGMAIAYIPPAGAIPSPGDGLGFIFAAPDGDGDLQVYSSSEGQIVSSTSGSEEGKWQIWLLHNGVDHVPYFEFFATGTSPLTGFLTAPSGKELALGADGTEYLRITAVGGVLASAENDGAHMLDVENRSDDSGAYVQTRYLNDAGRRLGFFVTSSAWAGGALVPGGPTGEQAVIDSDTLPLSLFGTPIYTAGLLLTRASASAGANLRVPHGAAPSSPVDGDIWTTTAGLFVRINGSTIGPLS